ncbi:gamma-aminobutyric acid receptor subunit epsilon-like [Frankliniella occidentalis]|uniref:Gamma-aminobutyric acid receptor subunit epsilon-like n=1 Tax=Frankliniella occidentalis TaxID=133901 RepID=A0A9C6U2R9_FRAOC|nr:gamma-aminobutyric acid receptor subunit epsilon-like [Frankliniella occidentalis]
MADAEDAPLPRPPGTPSSPPAPSSSSSSSPSRRPPRRPSWRGASGWGWSPGSWPVQLVQLALAVLLLASGCAAEYQQSLMFSDILPENPKLYDKMRPPKKDGGPTVVYFHVTVMGLDSIDENSMTYAADIFFAQTWKDHRLRLPENMTSEYRLLEVDWLKNMWRPDSFFKNAKAVTFQTMTIPNHYMWLYKDKTILYMVK